ncbi:MAG: ABC transporter substrate-binding protein [Lachnospiraceae bacterium]|nr:ABC transporter substrate-binding protein [Lachnospiraceae bacterium]
MKLKKTLKVFLAALLVMALTGGCVSQYVNITTEEETAAPTTKAPEPGSTEAPAPSTEADIRGQKLEIWYSLSGASGVLFEELSKKFSEEYGVEVELSYSGSYADTASKVSAAMLKGLQPDVVVTGSGQLYSGGEGDFRIGELLKTTNDFDTNDIFEGMLDYCDYMGQGICALPYGISTQVMYYNKDILKAAGVDMTNPPKTWAEFYEVCGKVMESAGDNTKLKAFDTYDEAWLFKSMLMQNGCEIIKNNDGKITPIFNNEKAIEVADYWKSLVDAGYMASGKHGTAAENAFLGGTLAFVASSSNRIARWTGTTTFELGAIIMPSFGSAPSMALGGNVLVLLTQDESKVTAAWKYMTYMANVENSTTFALNTGYLPTHKSALERQEVKDAIATNEMYSVAFSQLEYTWAYTSFQEMGTMDSQIKNALQKLEKNRGTAQEVLDTAVKKLQEEIDDN